tara:strand:+ start:72 stop:278 length:207 start_codon:yes stop_codon:yes gene_type:complete
LVVEVVAEINKVVVVELVELKYLHQLLFVEALVIQLLLVVVEAITLMVMIQLVLEKQVVKVDQVEHLL